MSDQRATDKIILEELRDIKSCLNDNESGLCGRVKSLETKTDSIQVEVREHKTNHKDWISMFIAIVALGIAFFKK